MQPFDFNREFDLCAGVAQNWAALDGKTVLITGASGLMGKYLILTLLRRNQLYGAGIRILAVGRNAEKFHRRFAGTEGIEQVMFLAHDVCEPFDVAERVDFIIHMASNTHPRLYAADPIGTEMTNILGTYQLLNLAAANPGCRFLFASSGDVYGDNRGGSEYLAEKDCGYIDCNTLRAGYIEGKRAGEALCNAFREAKDVDFVIARLCRIYSSTMTDEDSKAITQFIRNAARRQDIVLKSEGRQVFSYLYAFDAVTGLLTVLLHGQSGEAYNIADRAQAHSLRFLAETLADIAGTKVVFDLPDRLEVKGASSFENVRLDGNKLNGLGWRPRVGLKEGLRWTVERLRDAIKEG